MRPKISLGAIAWLNTARVRLVFVFQSLLLLAALPSGAAAPTTQSSAERPNILWLTCEDIGPQLGCYGDTYATTPNIENARTTSQVLKASPDGRAWRHSRRKRAAEAPSKSAPPPGTGMRPTAGSRRRAVLRHSGCSARFRSRSSGPARPRTPRYPRACIDPQSDRPPTAAPYHR